jgi:hypothetical protein
MAFDLLTGKTEGTDWSCGIGGDTNDASLAARAKPAAKTYAVVGFILGAMVGGAVLYAHDVRAKMPRARMRLPENA